MKRFKAKFSVGQIVQHRLLNYRGVIIDVDAVYQNNDILYALMEESTPPKDKPWYHILVDGADYVTYVSEQHLELDNSGTPINHPYLNKYFRPFEGSTYIVKKQLN